jgi:hypothetical protein
MIDFLLLAVLLIVAWLVASDSAWGAGITFVSVLIGGLLAMNFFEPLAAILEGEYFTSPVWQFRTDIVCLLGIFAVSVFLLRLIGLQLFPTYAEVLPMVYEAVRWGLGLATGYIVMAIIATSLHVAPLPREYLGFQPERRIFFGQAPDRLWLGWTQYISEHALRSLQSGGQPRIFDGPVYPRILEDPNSSAVWSSFPIRYAARRESHYPQSSR